MITLNQAQQQLQTAVSCRLGTETIELAQALGRVVSADVHSELAIPPADNSAMDGFAVNVKGTLTPGTKLTISQRIPAGVGPQPLQAGTAARIFTGGVLPSGANAVVIQENTEFDEQQVLINTLTTPGDNVRSQGQDIAAGATVVKAGQRLTAIDLGLLASIGKATVEVYRPLRVAVFSTGDELVNPGKALKPGQIYNSNRVVLMALCKQLGFTPIDCGIVEDTLGATKSALAVAANKADLIISSGGVSVGEEDHIKPAVESLGALQMWKVQMKPGKPVAFGTVADTPFLGLPGNPVSSYVVFQLLGLPLMRVLQGQASSDVRTYPVRANFDKKLTTREEYIRVSVARDQHGDLVAEPFVNSSSGVMSSLAWADGLVRQPIDTSITQGQQLAFLPFTEGLI